MTRPISRRQFVAQATLLALAVPNADRIRRARRAGPTVRVAVVERSTAPTDPREMGLLLGMEEATHAAALFGGALELIALPAGELTQNISAIVGNADCGVTQSIGKRAHAAGIPFFNVACRSDDLRGSGCQRTLFHVAPSEAMARDALALSHAHGEVMPWHPSLHRFGADTLNGRFVARFKTPMTSDAWTAWFTTKIVWESALRAGSADPAKLMEYLSRDTTQFDGHKGLPLSFRSWDRQLRQPLYVVDGTTVVEVPTGAPDRAPRNLLDQLGAQASTSSCHFS